MSSKNILWLVVGCLIAASPIQFIKFIENDTIILAGRGCLLISSFLIASNFYKVFDKHIIQSDILAILCFIASVIIAKGYDIAPSLKLLLALTIIVPMFVSVGMYILYNDDTSLKNRYVSIPLSIIFLTMSIIAASWGVLNVPFVSFIYDSSTGIYVIFTSIASSIISIYYSSFKNTSSIANKLGGN